MPFINVCDLHTTRSTMAEELSCRVIGTLALLQNFTVVVPQHWLPWPRSSLARAKNSMVHKAISDGLSNYEDVRGKVQGAQRMADKITRSVKKDYPTLGLDQKDDRVAVHAKALH